MTLMARHGSHGPSELFRLEHENKQLRAALQEIANREPQINTMPLDRAFAELREITKIAREAVEAR